MSDHCSVATVTSRDWRSQFRVPVAVCTSRQSFPRRLSVPQSIHNLLKFTADQGKGLKKKESGRGNREGPERKGVASSFVNSHNAV